MKSELIKKIIKFSEDRNWNQFHSLGNLAKSISIEANELLELFQWDNENVKDLESAKEELADVLIYCVLFANKINVDIDEIVEKKLSKNEEKYPIDKSYGNSKKYNEF